MSSVPNPAVVIESASPAFEAELAPALEALRATGLDVQFHHQPLDPQAFLEWLIPSAVAFFLADKYLGAMLGELGKSHYGHAKRGLEILYDKTLGKKASVTRELQRSDGTPQTAKVFSGNLSFVYQSPEGWRVKLLFPLDITADQYAQSCDRFFSLMAERGRHPETSPLEAEINAQAEEKREFLPPEVTLGHMRPRVSLLVFWDAAAQRFLAVDAASSSRLAELVAWPLGQRA